MATTLAAARRNVSYARVELAEIKAVNPVYPGELEDAEEHLAIQLEALDIATQEAEDDESSQWCSELHGCGDDY